MKNILLNVIGSASVLENHKVVDGELLVIDVRKGCNYELFDATTGAAPQNIIAKRVGQDLMIILDENEGEGSPDDIQPDIMIKGYYGEDRGEDGNTDATGILIGMHENGKYYAYIPESGESQDAVSILADEMAEPQAIGGEELECGAFFFPWWGLLGLLPLAFIGGGSDPEPEPVNNPPKLTDDTGQGEIGQPVTVDVLANDTDDKGIDPTTVRLLDKNNNPVSELKVPGEGKWTVDPATGKVTFTPENGFIGQPTPIQYTAKDTEGKPAEKPATITVKFPESNPPHATDDLVENIEIGQSVTIDVVGTDNGGNGVDSDPENNIDPTTVKLVDADPNSNGKIKTVPNEGTWKVNPDGTVTFTPLPTFKADPKPVKYTVKDTTGLESNEATITADYQPYETAPVSEEDFGTEPEDTPIKGNVLENDKDDDGDVLKVKDFSLDTDGDGVVDTTYQPGEVVDVYKNGAKIGALTIAENGDYTFTPVPNWNGKVPAIEYTLIDEDGNEDPTKVTLEITPVQDPPVAVDDKKNTSKATPVVINVLENDSDPDNDIDPKSVKLINPETGDEVTTVTITGEGTYTVQPDGQVKFEPTQTFTGKSTLKYVVYDEGKEGDPANPTPARSNPATITVTVADGLEPVTKPDTNTTKQGKPVSSDATTNLLANDNDPDGDPLTVTEFTITGMTGTFPADGTPVEMTKDGKVIGSILINSDGSYTFTPVPDFTGNIPSVIYTANDGVFDKTSTLDIYVDGVPDAKDDTYSVPKDEPSTFNPLENDTHPQKDDLTITKATVPPEQGTVVVNDDGTLTFTPNPNFDGKPEITYTIVDKNGDKDTATVTLTLIPNKAPIAEPNVIQGNEDSEVIGNLIDDASPAGLKDRDEDGTVVGVTKFTTPDGVDHIVGDTPVAVMENGEEIGKITVKSDGSYKFVPAENYNGDVPTIKYTIKDDKGLTSQSTLDIKIKPEPDAPVADDNAIRLAEGTEKSLGLTLPKDIDSTLEQLTIKVTELPKIGTVTKADGTPVSIGDVLTGDELTTLKFIAPDEYTKGSDIGSFKYSVTDETDLVDVGEVTFKVDNIRVSNSQVQEGEDLVFDVTLAEPSDKPTTLTLTPTFTGDANTAEPEDIGPLSVTYIDIDGTEKDLASNPDGTYTVPANVTELKVKALAINDDIYEKSERFTLTGSVALPDGSDISDDGIGTILDDNGTNESDKPVVNINATDAEAIEGKADDTIKFEISQTKPSNFDTTVNAKLVLETGEGKVSVDDIKSITYTDAAGQTTVYEGAKIQELIDTGVPVVIPKDSDIATTKPSFTITPKDDFIKEGDETFKMSISEKSGTDVNATIGKAEDTGTIKDEDGTDPNTPKDAIYVEIVDDNDSDLAEGSSRELTIQLHDKAGNAVEAITDVTVDVAYSGTNGKGVDFNGVEQVTIKAGKDKTTLTIEALDDYLKEGQETLDITISNPQGGGFEDIKVDTNNIDGDTTGSGDNDATDDKADVIINDEKKPFDPTDPNNPDNQDAVFVKIAVDKTSVNEGGEVVYTVSIVDKAGNAVTIPADKGDVNVTLNWANSTANADDLTETEFPATITIPKGSDKVQFTLHTNDDDVKENTETLIPEITTVVDTGEAFEDIRPHSTANGAPSNAITVTTEIVDNDAAPIARISPVNAQGVEPKTATSDDETNLTFKVDFENAKTLPEDATITVKPTNLSEVEKEDIKEVKYTDANGEVQTVSAEEFFTNGIPVTIKAGQTEAPVITIVPAHDDIYEKVEKIELKITKPDTDSTAYTVGEHDKAEGTIKDDDNPATPNEPKDGDKPVVNINATDAEAIEGKENDTIKFEISQTKASNFDTTVNAKLVLETGEGKVSVDDIKSITYTDAAGTETVYDTPEKIQELIDTGVPVVIPKDSDVANTKPSFTITPKDDFIKEGDETFKMSISEKSGTDVNATIGKAEDTGTIKDEDGTDPNTPKDAIYVEIVDDNDSDLAEGSSRELTIQLHDKDGNAVEAITDVTVDVAYSGTDGKGVDFNGVEQVTIKAGKDKTTLTIEALDDYLKEGQETLDITISNPQGGGFEAIEVDTNNVDGDTTGSGDNDATDDKADVIINDEANPFDPTDPNNPDNQDAVFVKIAVDKTSVNEGGEVVYTVSIVDKAGNAVTIPADKGDVNVTLNWANSTANADDLTETAFPTTITIPKGSDKVQFTLHTNDDDVKENTETLIPEITTVVDTGEAFENIRPHSEANGAPSDAITVTTEIIDNDAAPIARIAPVQAQGVEPKTATSNDATNLTFKVDFENAKTLPEDATITVKPTNLSEVKPEDIKEVQYTDANGEVQTVTADVFFTSGIPVVIKAGQTEAPVITLVPAHDDIYEKVEKIELQITKPASDSTAYTVGANDKAEGTISDDDNPDTPEPEDGDKPLVNINATDAEAIEGKADDTIKFEISQTKPSNFDTTVNAKLVLETGEGKVSVDDIKSITYTDAAGQTTVYEGAKIQELIDTGVPVVIPKDSDVANTKPSFTITPKDDYVAEGDETFKMSISEKAGTPVNATIGKAEDTGTIKDEDGTDPNTPKDAIYVEIVDDDDSDLAEGQSRELTIQLHDKEGNAVEAITDVTVDVAYSGTNGKGVDFNGVEQVTISAGNSSTTLTIEALDDYLKEGQETLDITISNPQGGGFEAIEVDTNNIDGDTTGSGDNDATDDKADVIINDEPNPGAEDTVFAKISVDKTTVADNNAANEGDAIKYTVSLVDKDGNVVTVPTGKTVDVSLDWAGTADADDIKSSTLGDKLPTSVTIAGGASQTEFTLTTEDDNVHEETETLIPTITDVTDDGAFEAIKPSLTANGAKENAITTTTEIVDNDEILVASITSDEVVEGNELEHTVTLNTTSTTPTTVNVTLTSGTATVGTDTGTPVKVSFDNGDSWEDVTVGADGTFDVSVPAGKNSFKVQVPSTEDWDYEKPNEQYTISAAIGSQTAKTATGTIIDPDWVRVSEEGLTDDANHLFDGIKDTTGQDNDPQALDGLAPDTTDSATATGNLALGGNIKKIEYIGTPITTEGGKAVTWEAWNANTNELVAKNAAGEKIITISVNGDSYTATLNAPVDHTMNDNIEDVLDLKFKATNNKGETGRFVVGVEDDMPNVGDIAPEITVESNLKTNVLIAVDLSKSMLADKDGDSKYIRDPQYPLQTKYIENPDYDGVTKLALAKEAIENLIVTYADYGDVKVKIVGFADKAATQTTGWVDIADAIAALNQLKPNLSGSDPIPNGIGGGTNYDAALAESKRGFEEDMNGYLTDGTNQLYFLTDGKPVRGDGDINNLVNTKEKNSIWINPKTGEPLDVPDKYKPIDVGINDTEKGIWETFVNGKKVNVHAVGFGDAVKKPLDPIAYDGTKSEDTDGVIVGADGLKNQLEKMIVIEPLTGNIINSASNTDPNPNSAFAFGADESGIRTVKIADKEFLYDYDTNKVTDVATGIVTENTSTISLTTSKGSALSLNMRTGEYEYKAHPSVAIAGGTEDIAIKYSVKDKDGDADSATTTLKFKSAHEEKPVPVVEIVAGENPNEALEGEINDTLSYRVQYENNATVNSNNTVKVKVDPSSVATADDIATIKYYDINLGYTVTLNEPEEIQEFFTNGIDVKIYGSQNAADDIIFTAKKDTEFEPNELLRLVIDKPTGASTAETNYTMGTQTADGEIINVETPADLIVDNAGSIKEPKGEDYLTYDVYLSNVVDRDVSIKVSMVDYADKVAGKPHSSLPLTKGESRQSMLDNGWEPDANITDDRLLGNDIAQKLEYSVDGVNWQTLPDSGVLNLSANTVKANALKVRAQVHADELNEANEYVVVKAEVQPQDTNRISVKATDHNGVTGDYLDGATKQTDGSWTFTDDGGDNYGVGVIEAGDQVRVSEEGLAWGWRDRDIYGRRGESTQNSTERDEQWDRTNSAMGTRYMGFGDGFNVTEIQHLPDNAAYAGGPADVTSGGKAITWTWNETAKTLTGTVNVGNGQTEKVMDILIKDGATGKNEVTLYRQIDHPDNTPLTKDDAIRVNGQKLGGVEDEIALRFKAIASNGSETEEMNFSVIVEDDSPFINVIDAEINNTPTVNLLLTMDVSGSMGFVDFTNGSSQIIKKEVNYTPSNGNRVFTFDMDQLTAPQVNPDGKTVKFDPEGWKFYGIQFGNDIATNNIQSIKVYDASGSVVSTASGPSSGNAWRLMLDPNKYSKADIEGFTLQVVTKNYVSPGSKLTVELDADRATHAKEALIELIHAYEAKGKIVNAKIVEFSQHTIKNYSPWLTGKDAVQFLKDGLYPNGGTDYEKALRKLMDSYENGMPLAQDTISYFISDGEPSFPAGYDVKMHNFEQQWLDFLAEKDINNSYAIGVTQGLATKHLNEVAHSSEVNYEDFKYDNGVVDNPGNNSNSNHTHKDKDPHTPNTIDGNRIETEANVLVSANPDDVIAFLLDTVKAGSASGNSLEAQKGRGKVISIIGADKAEGQAAIDDVKPIFNAQDGTSFIFENATGTSPQYKRVNGTVEAGDEHLVYIYNNKADAEAIGHAEGTVFKYGEWIQKINDGVLIFDKTTGKYHFEMTSNGVTQNDGKKYSYRVDVIDGDGDRSSARINVTVDSANKSIQYKEILVSRGDFQEGDPQPPAHPSSDAGFEVLGWSVPSGAGYSTDAKTWATLEGHGLETAKVYALPNIQGWGYDTNGMGVWSSGENSGSAADLRKWRTHINTREIMQVKFDEPQTELEVSLSRNFTNSHPKQNTAIILFYKDGKLVGERGGTDIPVSKYPNDGTDNNNHDHSEEPNNYRLYKAMNDQPFDEVRIINTAGEMSVHNMVARNRSQIDPNDPFKDDNTYIIYDNDFTKITDNKGWDVLAVESQEDGSGGIVDFTANGVAEKAQNMEVINMKEDIRKQEITLDFDSIQTLSAEDEIHVIGGSNDIVKVKGTSITQLAKDHTDDGILYDHYQVNHYDNVVDLYITKGTQFQKVRNDGTPRSDDPSADDNTVGYSNDIEFTYTDTGAGRDTLMFNPADDITLDFNSIASKVKNIEVINMEDSSSTGDAITIGASDVLAMTDSDNDLFINGDANDSVDITDFTKQVNSDQTGYNMYTSANDITLYIDTDITNII